MRRDRADELQVVTDDRDPFRAVSRGGPVAVHEQVHGGGGPHPDVTHEIGAGRLDPFPIRLALADDQLGPDHVGDEAIRDDPVTVSGAPPPAAHVQAAAGNRFRDLLRCERTSRVEDRDRLHRNARCMKAAIWPRVTGWSGQKRSLSGGLQPRVMSAAARALMSAWKSGFWSSGIGSGACGSWRARRMKAAIWPRVTGWSGQKRSLSGGLQPRVMSAAARALMSAWKIEFWSSENRSGPSGSWRARRMKAAIWPRVTGRSGQERSLSGGLQPRVRPAAARATIAAWKS